MTSLTNKVLKFELLFLFIVASFSIISFYFGEGLPDNFLAISSQSEKNSFLSYTFSSILMGMGYYLGPWTIAPFLVFAIFYNLQFSKRNIPLDTVNFISLVGGSFFLFYFFAPEFLGLGAKYFVKISMTRLEALSVGSFLFIAFLAGSFRRSFKDASIQFFVFLGEFPNKSISFIRLMNPRHIFSKLNAVFNKASEKSHVFVPNFLKGSRGISKRAKNNKMPFIGEKRSYFEKTKKKESNLLIKNNIKKEDSNEFSDEKDNEEWPQDGPSQLSLDKKQSIERYKEKNQNKKKKQYYEIVTTITDPREKRFQAHPDQNYFENIIFKIEETLREFKIEGQIVNILKGPVVDTFELELGSGVKVSRVNGAENEISMALLGAPIRIVYPMIGRATVGIEVPRNPREIIYLDEVLSSGEFKSSKNKLPICMGKDAYGEPLVVDLASMPHMLVAGATGAGKSVFINTLLVSLLVKKSPDQMKLILIDPKQLELALYAKLPHLLMPVVTDAKTASVSLLWACQEMDRRYSILKEFGVRNIEGFNEKLKIADGELLAKIHQFYENEPDDHYELPYIVVIIDEFADLILTKAGKEIEFNVSRLAAKARAAGIHLVVATQRPSVDVITGVIKTNFPTRVSFRVTSPQDSRTILNTIGAEKLLGKGDMLYRHGTNNQRVHSAYVDEDEIEALTDKLSEMPRNYHNGAIEFLENGGENAVSDPFAAGSHIPGGVVEANSDDEHLKNAIRIVVEHRTASASMLQRRMKIGYNRAANLIEEMESKGIVGPAEGSKRRKVLWSSEDLAET